MRVESRPPEPPYPVSTRSDSPAGVTMSVDWPPSTSTKYMSSVCAADAGRSAALSSAATTAISASDPMLFRLLTSNLRLPTFDFRLLTSDTDPPYEMLMRMRIGLVVTGGVDRSGRERVMPSVLWFIERLARRHDVHAFVLHNYRDPCVYPLAGATIHDLGRVDGPRGLRRLIVRRRLAEAVAANGPFDLLHAYFGMPGVVATAVGRRLSLPVVVTVDSGELVAFDDIQYGLQRRWIDRRAVIRALHDAAR